MALNIKNKIWIGTLFLFALLLITSGVNMYFLFKIKKESKNILQDNYGTLSYCQTMQHALFTLNENYDSSIKEFNNALQAQEKNITEPGEYDATMAVQKNFTNLVAGDTVNKNLREIGKNIQKILYINLHAIEAKNNTAQQNANDALTITITIAGIIFLISFTFIINFPSVITRPVYHMTSAIKEIANKNYKYRIHMDNKDEFGQLADAFNEMAARLENFESSNLNRIMFEKNRAEAVINSLKDPSIGIDKNDVVLFANYQALQLLGLSTEDLIGKSSEEVSHKNDLLRFLLESESVTPFKVVIDSQENYFVKEIVEVVQGDAKNKVIVLKNITSFKQLDAAKTNFIATISHELKTPLASSDFSLKLLQDKRTGGLSKEQEELIKNIEQDNRRMLKILSELLNISQIETGRIQLNIQQVQPEQIMDKAIEAVAGNAKEKNISIHKNISSPLPEIRADADKTMWILNNLLTNAIKFSHSDSIIQASALQGNGSIVFSVTDKGPGIPKEFIEKIFDRYFQVPGSNEKGSGLGLAISKDFAEAQQGKIWAESEPGKGSVFYFSLPA